MQLFLWIKKEIDTVDHATLISKLQHLYAFPSSAYNPIIASYLSNRSQITKIHNYNFYFLYHSKRCTPRIYFGSVLFNLIVNDTLSTHNNTYSGADDTLTFTNAKNEHEAKTMLQKQFNELKEWYETNGLNLNVPKSKYPLITNHNLSNPSSLTLNNIEFKPEKSIVILGITLDKRLTLETHIDKVVQQSNILIYILRKIRHLLNYEEANKFA